MAIRKQGGKFYWESSNQDFWGHPQVTEPAKQRDLWRSDSYERPTKKITVFADYMRSLNPKLYATLPAQEKTLFRTQPVEPVNQTGRTVKRPRLYRTF